MKKQITLQSGLFGLPGRNVAVGMGVLVTGAVWMSATTGAIAQSLPSGSTTGNEDVIVDPESPTPAPGRTLAGTRFTCQMVNGQYTVMYQPESQPGQAYPWAVPAAMGGGWDPARRCSEITRRLELYRPDGLQEMKTAVENGYNTVCVTTQRMPGCRIVLTVPPGQDPTITRDRVFQNLTVADSGQQTQGVNTFVAGGRGSSGIGGSGILGDVSRWLNIGIPGSGSSNAYSSGNINLRPFLDRADGGTGQYLRNGRSVAPGRRLNPNKFR